MFNRPLTQIQRWPQAQSSRNIGSGIETSEREEQSPVMGPSPLGNDMPLSTQRQGRQEFQSKEQSGLKALRLPLEVRSETRMETSLRVP